MLGSRAATTLLCFARMASHGAFTATTILNAADNLFAQLKVCLLLRARQHGLIVCFPTSDRKRDLEYARPVLAL